MIVITVLGKIFCHWDWVWDFIWSNVRAAVCVCVCPSGRSRGPGTARAWGSWGPPRPPRTSGKTLQLRHDGVFLWVCTFSCLIKGRVKNMHACICLFVCLFIYFTHLFICFFKLIYVFTYFFLYFTYFLTWLFIFYF